MDVVEFASAEVGRGCGCCGCGFPWFEGGWLDGFVYKALTVGHGISHEKTSIWKKINDSVRPEIG